MGRPVRFVLSAIVSTENVFVRIAISMLSFGSGGCRKMEDGEFEGLRQWIQDQIMFQGSQSEVMSGNTCRSSTGPSQPKPTSSRKVAWNNDSNDSEDGAAHSFSTANAGPCSEKTQALTDEQKEMLNYKEEEVRT